MQTLETRKINEIEDYYFIQTNLTNAGRKKIIDLFDYVYENGAPYAVEDAISDIEYESSNGMMHPVFSCRGYTEELIENVDYILEYQSKEAFELALIAKHLNDVHGAMQEEMNRLGW